VQPRGILRHRSPTLPHPGRVGLSGHGGKPIQEPSHTETHEYDSLAAGIPPAMLLLGIRQAC
jgi:hypothetical protein